MTCRSTCEARTKRYMFLSVRKMVGGSHVSVGNCGEDIVERIGEPHMAHSLNFPPPQTPTIELGSVATDRQ